MAASQIWYFLTKRAIETLLTVEKSLCVAVCNACKWELRAIFKQRHWTASFEIHIFELFCRDDLKGLFALNLLCHTEGAPYLMNISRCKVLKILSPRAY